MRTFQDSKRALADVAEVKPRQARSLRAGHATAGQVLGHVTLAAARTCDAPTTPAFFQMLQNVASSCRGRSLNFEDGHLTPPGILLIYRTCGVCQMKSSARPLDATCCGKRTIRGRHFQPSAGCVFRAAGSRLSSSELVWSIAGPGFRRFFRRADLGSAGGGGVIAGLEVTRAFATRRDDLQAVRASHGPVQRVARGHGDSRQ